MPSSTLLSTIRRAVLLTAVVLLWALASAEVAKSNHHFPHVQKSFSSPHYHSKRQVDEKKLEYVSPRIHWRKLKTTESSHDDQTTAHSIKKTEQQGGSSLAVPPILITPQASDVENKVFQDRKGEEKIGTVEKEELKVKTATQRLVTWLRNRLRKRLSELAELENTLRKLENVAAEYDAAKLRVQGEREKEIQKKVTSQKELANFRLQFVEPDEQLRIVSDQTQKLEKKMMAMKQTYDGLGKMQSELESKLRQAGFSHWLEARGQQYLPETAVGVLSKSTEILDPLVEGIERAVAIDHNIARDFDGLVPMVHSPLVAGVVSDIFVLVPLIPILALAGRVSFSINRLTVVQFIFYLSAAFAAQCLGCFLVSLSLTEEAIHYFQKTNDPVVIGLLFLTASLYSCFIFLHFLAALVNSSKRNVTHLILVLCIGYNFYVHVFRRAVLDQEIFIPVTMHATLCISFLFIMTDRNSSLGLSFPLQREMQQILDAFYDWMDETVEAMKISTLGERANAIYEEEEDGEEAYEKEIKEKNRDCAKNERRQESKHYRGTVSDRPLAMGESRGSSFSIATSVYERAPRMPSSRQI